MPNVHDVRNLRTSGNVVFLPSASMPAVTPQPSNYSEVAIARAFVRTYRTTIRFVAARGVWLIRNKAGEWRLDETLVVAARVRRYCESLAKSCHSARTRSRLLSYATVTAVLALARFDQRIAETTDFIPTRKPRRRRAGRDQA